MANLLRDVKHAWRALRRRPAYFLTCAATLALVLGANSAIFAVVNATLLRPLPFTAGERVVNLFMLPPGLSAREFRNPAQQMDVARLRERSRTMKRIEGFLRGDRVITAGGEPTVVPAAAVTPGLFEMMRAPVQAGRAFLPGEEQPGQLVAMITDGYWRRALGAGSVVGSTLAIDGQPYTIVGILGPDFPPQFLRADVFIPLFPNPAPAGRNPSRSVVTAAELADGATVEAAAAETREIIRQMTQEFPQSHNGWTGGAQSMRDWLFGTVHAPVLMLFAAAGFVLLIACANVANLTSANAAARSADLTLRVALGATRLDVMRLQTAELLLISAAGLVPGLLIAWAAVPALLALDPVAARSLGSVAIDWRVLAFSALAAVLTSVGASLLPALQTFRAGRAARRIADGGLRTAGSRRAARTQRILVVGEVALCLALLMAGAVLVRGLEAVTRLQPGFDGSGVLTAHVRLPEAAYSTPQSRVTVVNRILESLRSIPSVEAASTTLNDFVPGNALQTQFHVENRPTANGQSHTTMFRRVSPDYFRAMRIRELSGRTFTAADTADQPAVAVVSKGFAEQLFPGEEAVGRVIRRTAVNSPPTTIVGVVDDARDVSLTQAPEPTLYLPWAQNNNTVNPVALVIRTNLEPTSIVPAVREALRAIDPSLPLRNAQPLETFLSDSLAPERFRTTVLGVIALLGLVLAALGIYGVTYRGVVERSREFAIRLALGSEPGGVVRMVVGEALMDVGAGAALGLAAGALLCMLMARVIAHVGAADPLSTAASVAVLALSAVAAALVPALRVLRVQPADALRMS